MEQLSLTLVECESLPSLKFDVHRELVIRNKYFVWIGKYRFPIQDVMDTLASLAPQSYDDPTPRSDKRILRALDGLGVSVVKKIIPDPKVIAYYRDHGGYEYQFERGRRFGEFFELFHKQYWEFEEAQGYTKNKTRTWCDVI